MLYLVNTLDDIPSGTEYRVIGECLPYWDNKTLVETKTEIPGLEVAPAAFPNGVSTDTTECIAEWQIKE